MEGVCLRAICASGNLPHKEVLCKPFRGEFCLGGSVDACPEPFSHFVTICRHLMRRWIPKNMQSVVPGCALKELMNLEHRCSGLFCIFKWSFLNRWCARPEVGYEFHWISCVLGTVTLLEISLSFAWFLLFQGLRQLFPDHQHQQMAPVISLFIALFAGNFTKFFYTAFISFLSLHMIMVFKHSTGIHPFCFLYSFVWKLCEPIEKWLYKQKN